MGKALIYGNPRIVQTAISALRRQCIYAATQPPTNPIKSPPMPLIASLLPARIKLDIFPV